MENKKIKNLTELVQKFQQPKNRIPERGKRKRGRKSIKEIICMNFPELKDVSCLTEGVYLRRAQQVKTDPHQAT